MRVFGIKHHGLGDSLAFSHLPERFTKESGEQCYFYENDISHFKNQEIYNLVWAMNPYMKGLTDIRPNSGGVIGTSIVKDSKTVVWNYEIKHGFKPKNLCPKIYYEPKEIEKLKDVTIIDLNSFHYYKAILQNRHKIKELVMSMIEGECMFISYENKIGVEEINADLFGGFASYKIRSLLHYCDVINSCNKYICANSGGNSLSSAINGGAEVIMTDINEGYAFPNNNYHYL